MENVIVKKSVRGVLAIFSIVFAFIMFWIMCDCFPKDKVDTKKAVNYTVDQKLSYNINLKDNAYYTNDSSRATNFYVTSLVNSIDLNFLYEMNMEEMVDSVYNYKVSVFLSATKDDENVWNDTTELFNSSDYNLTGVNTVNLDKNFSINFNEYYNKAMQYYNLTGIPVTMKINVEVNNTLSVDGKSISSPLDYEISFVVTDKTFSVNKTNDKKIKKTVSLANEYRTSFNSHLFILSTITFVALVPLAIISLCSLFNLSNYDEYNKRVKEIKKQYGPFIKQCKNIPVFRRKEIIEVKSIKKVYDQLDKEYIIMFEKEKNAECWFYVEKDKEVYLYILKLSHNSINLNDNSMVIGGKKKKTKRK